MKQLSAGCRPQFIWQGSNLTVGEAVDGGCDLFRWLGNQWADVFAGLGRDDVTLAESFVKDCQLKFECAVDAIQMLGQLVQRDAQWASKLEFQQIPKVSQATDRALRSLRTNEKFKRCEPAQVLSWEAGSFFQAHPELVPANASQAVLVESKPSVPGAILHFCELGHAPVTFGPITICKKCAR
ncbi:unnamed protein product [Prorocentrum cordatum]|uniref:Selenoprotein O n=1 Tax=Prorocentrum cordatum TaxID=2364126 RepID=A0ABN9XTI2_9DINO|nr:unnamed protein product [Polarella glacialis]